MPVQTLSFELRYRKEARNKNAGKMVRDQDRYKTLPDVPPSYRAARGGYKYVASRAQVLNDAQLRSGFLDYLFFPEVATAPKGSEPIADDA